MRRLSLSSLAILSLLALSAPALAEVPLTDATGAAAVTAQLVAQAQATPPASLDQAPATPGEVNADEVLQLVAQAVSSRNWGLLACALVLGAVWLVRRVLAPRVPWLSSDTAGVALSLVTAVVLSLSATLGTGRPLSLSLVLGAVLTAAGASGLWSWGRKVKASFSPVAKPPR